MLASSTEPARFVERSGSEIVAVVSAATVGSKTDGLRVNDDGSVDVLYGPESPGAEWETNWVKTIPRKGFFVYFRLYGVEQPFFDKSWQLPPVAPIDFATL